MTAVARASIAQSMWALLAALLFSLMAVFVKRGLTQFAPMELVFYRAALGAAALFALARFRARTFRTAHFRLHCGAERRASARCRCFFSRSAGCRFRLRSR